MTNKAEAKRPIGIKKLQAHIDTGSMNSDAILSFITSPMKR